MAATRFLLSANSCNKCRYHLLNTFASLAGLAPRPATISRHSRPQFTGTRTNTTRSFVTSRSQRALAEEQTDQSDDGFNVGIESTLDDPNGFVTVLHQTENSTPWYLQIQPPVVQERTMSDRQKLPDLPENPPLLLQPILEYLSVETGLDDLTLLDMRKLDPPPALGANLIMLIATARSEKHLHVSADRFARWLRSTHKLSPYADGLLGRNELKLKLRRKARRTKLLGSVGSSDKGSDDDGIRTGWVCVNVGSIEQEHEVKEVEEMSQNFVGFGRHSDGARLVVQMLTEEKREELDLETLWGQALVRQQRKEAREAEKQLDETGDHEVGHSPPSHTQSNADTSLLTMSSLAPRTTLPQHSRAYHSNARSLRPLQDRSDSIADPERLDTQSVVLWISSPQAAKRTTKSVEHEFSEVSNVPQMSRRHHTMSNLLKKLKSRSKEYAIKALGVGADDCSSTSFLRSFYQNFSTLPNHGDLQFRFDLLFHAFSIGHPRYSRGDVLGALREMQCSFADIPPTVYEDALTVLAGPNSTTKHGESGGTSSAITDIGLMFDILSDMSLRGVNILDESVSSKLLIALAQAEGNNREPASELNGDAVWRLINHVEKEGTYFQRSSTHYFVLHGLATAGNWDSFWRYWRGIPQRVQRRSFMLYALMFRSVANKKHQADCVNALRDWTPEMDLEEPRVPLKGILATAIIDCLKVAHPGFSDDEMQRFRLFRDCQKARHLQNQISREELEDGLLNLFNRMAPA